jgi:hypothetical protein
MKDFFTRYRESHKNPVIVPAIFWLALSFAVVANMQGTNIDLKSISANVVSWLDQNVSYPADLIMEREGNTLKFIIWKDAEKVKSIHFSILGNPAVFTKVETQDTNTQITMNEPGVALIIVNINSSMKAWDLITTVLPTLSWETSLALIDAGFSSESGEYSLSVKGE